jgi:hypothetical protein
LVYLAIQIRQNTNAMGETRKVELARNRTQTIQIRADWMLEEASSEIILDMCVRLREAGWPDPRSLEILTPVERARLGRLQRVNLLINTNAKYQYELGLIDAETFSSSARILELLSPVWLELGIGRLLGVEDERRMGP